MNAVDNADITPILLLEADLSQPLSDIDLVHSKTGKRYTRAQLLVRLYTSPIGYVHIEHSSGRVNAEVLSQLIWNELQREIIHYLQDNNLPSVDRLEPSGFSGIAAPQYIQTRE